MDFLSVCQLLSFATAVLWVRFRCSREAIAALVCVVFANAFLTGFEMRMGTESVTWQHVFARQVDGDTMTTLFFAGVMYASIIAMFAVFIGLQVGKIVVAGSGLGEGRK